MTTEAWGILSGIVTIIGHIPYLRDIIRKTTKPERASWLIWSVLGSIAFASQLVEGASDSLWLPGIETLFCILVFILSIKFGQGGLLKRDYYALAGAITGLLIWFFTQKAAYALYIVILIDAIGAYLTVIKAYEDPESETMIAWVMSGISGLLAMVAVGNLNFILLSYPLYIFLANAAVVLAMVAGRKKKMVV